jgi:Matrixin
MGRRSISLGLLGFLIAAALVLVLRPGPCARPLAYRLDQFDDRFGISREELRDALRQAEEVWERALGRDLFMETSTARLAVNLIYDERQQRTQTANRLRGAMNDTRASHESVGRSYDEWRATYERRVRDFKDAQAEYQSRAEALNAQVQEWNARGGAPADARAALEAERSRLAEMRQRLESDRAALQELAATVSGIAEKGNAIAQTHNQSVSTFNALYGAPRQFHKGEFDGRQIAVFEFHDRRDLVLLLAHELGHALGIRHVDDSAAIMHAVAGGQPIGSLALTEADLAALRKACRRF